MAVVHTFHQFLGKWMMFPCLLAEVGWFVESVEVLDLGNAGQGWHCPPETEQRAEEQREVLVESQ